METEGEWVYGEQPLGVVLFFLRWGYNGGENLPGGWKEKAMLTYSHSELLGMEKPILRYINNENLMRYLTDENEITILVNLYRIEMVILSLPVLVEGLYDFKRVLLIDEEDTETMVLVYQDELVEASAFRNLISKKQGLNHVKESLYEVAIDVFMECLYDVKHRYEDIERHVLEERHVDDNIISIMRHDTILQKAVPNVEGIAMLAEEQAKRGDPSDMVMVNRMTSLKIELVQIKGMLSGLSQLGENISHTIDSINNYMLNRVMRTLTILTVCIAIPTLIAGLYGMNIPLPFQEFEWVMQIISGISILIIGVVLLVFKRKRYF